MRISDWSSDVCSSDLTPRIRAVMQHALGEERAATMLARITPPARSRAFNALRWMDAKTSAALVETEHPQLAALVLAPLAAATAADGLILPPSVMQADVIYPFSPPRTLPLRALHPLGTPLAPTATHTP